MKGWVSTLLFSQKLAASVSSCPCCLSDATIVLPGLPAFYLFICLCWPQAPCLQHHAILLQCAVLPTTAAASSPSYHISANVGRRQPLPQPAWIHITISITLSKEYTGYLLFYRFYLSHTCVTLQSLPRWGSLGSPYQVGGVIGATRGHFPVSPMFPTI